MGRSAPFLHAFLHAYEYSGATSTNDAGTTPHHIRFCSTTLHLDVQGAHSLALTHSTPKINLNVCISQQQSQTGHTALYATSTVALRCVNSDPQ